jgi:hypothetical protein
MHYRTTRAVVGAAALLAGLAIAGCSKDSPTGPTSLSVAAHFDSLYVAAIAAHTHGDSTRAAVLSFMELATAYGAVPTTVSVTTATGVEQWKGVALEVADTSTTASANVQYLAATYSDANVTNVMYSAMQIGTASADTVAILLAADTIEVTGAGTAAATLLSDGGACTVATGLTNPSIAAGANFVCNIATMQFAANVTFPATAGVDASLQSIAYAAVSMKGPRFTTGSP